MVILGTPRRFLLFAFLALFFAQTASGMLFIPMDDDQTDHLKAYGIVYKMLRSDIRVFWLLNYRGGSFAADNAADFEVTARSAGVSVQKIGIDEWAGIIEQMKTGNMEKVTLEKSPRIAVYTPLSLPPWDDAVTLALTYADIPFDKVYDKEVVSGQLTKYDWLHLHHEDFTGQYSKFYASFAGAPWYRQQKAEMEKLAGELGFRKVSDCKKAVALSIRKFVENGGFLFAMCTATNTLDVALSALGTDIVPGVCDGDGVDPSYKSKLDYASCLAFENFEIQTDPMAQYFDDIDVNNVASGPDSVLVTNTTFGGLVPVTVVPASFVNVAPPNTPPRPGLIVNAGDEAGVRTVGPLAGIVADDIYAVAHGLFNIQINGNLP
nr:hypothetical protein [Chitinispirillaceae bacterium]